MSVSLGTFKGPLLLLLFGWLFVLKQGVSLGSPSLGTHSVDTWLLKLGDQPASAS